MNDQQPIYAEGDYTIHATTGGYVICLDDEPLIDDVYPTLQDAIDTVHDCVLDDKNSLVCNLMLASPRGFLFDRS